MNMHLTTDVAPRANVQAERSDGPNGPRSRSHPCARAEQRSGMGGARASRASLTDSLHLFEVSERSERCELCNAPMTRAPQAAPDAAGRRGRGNRGRLLFAYVLLEGVEEIYFKRPSSMRA